MHDSWLKRTLHFPTISNILSKITVQVKILKYTDMGFVKLLLIILELKGQNVLHKRLNR